jgi:hypothetical protein
MSKTTNACNFDIKIHKFVIQDSIRFYPNAHGEIDTYFLAKDLFLYFFVVIFRDKNQKRHCRVFVVFQLSITMFDITTRSDQFYII